MRETHSQSTRCAVTSAPSRRHRPCERCRGRWLWGIVLLVAGLATSARAEDGVPLPPESSLRTSPPAKSALLPAQRDHRKLSAYTAAAADWRKTLRDRWNGLPPETAQRMFLLGGIFLVLIAVQRFWIQRIRAGLPAGAVQVCGRVPLGPKQFVHLVRVGERLLVLLESPQGTQRIAEITDPAEVDRLLLSTRDPRATPSRATAPLPAWESSTPRVSQVLAQFRDWEQRGNV